MEINVDVIIVGYGPAGAVLASLLGQRGHRVAVLEKFPSPYNLPRMSTLDGEIARVLQHTADPEKALEDSLPQPAAYLYGADGELVSRADWNTVVCGHPERLSLHQPNIESAMHTRVDSCSSVQVFWGTEATAIDNLEDHVVITATKVASDDTNTPAEEFKVRARYAVGMDGGSSFVREAVGIKMEVLKVHDDEWQLTDYDILDPAVEATRTEVHMDVPRPYYWGPNGARRCRIDMKLLPDDGPEVRTHAAALAYLKEKTGILPEAVRITRQVIYRFRSAIAQCMRVGNVFIGGDAAHLMTPGMAQGCCSAIRDGINLAWRLDLVLTSRANAAILDSYGPERLGHVTPLVQGSILGWQMTTETDPAKAATRDNFIRAGLAPAPPKPTLTTGILQRTADNLAQLAGTLSPQGRVRIDGREGLLDSLVGFGFQLVSRIPVDALLSPAQQELLDKLGAHIVVLGSEAAVDLDMTYQNYLEAHGLVAYLSRPDFYIFGTAATADDIPVMVDALAKQLAQPVPDTEQLSAIDEPVTLPGAKFVHKTIPALEFTIHYAEAGPSNPAGTIVSIPGSAGLEMSTAKDQLAGRYRVLEVNPPGWGDQTDVSRPMPQSEIGVILARAVEQLVDGPFVLIATSMGGGNAMYLASQMPDRVRGIILEGSMTPCRPQDLRPMSTSQPPIHPKKPWATQAYVAHQMSNRMRMVQNTPPDMEATPAITTVRERGIPVLSLVGDADEVMKPNQETVQAVLPQAEFQLVPEGRHDLQNTVPEEFVSRVESLIDERLA
ncbi:uncharacterized protein N7496_001532 [Penicillium cataractarum]|uniref:FAD-binding domain-containing protein n=1 Tax=Penicillium cataractarum TaxID=2100454 RepID=A0A9W9VWJ8_9EURO|nr:uncharacterized protein N7496_001532 [Penicillium cataractarum]KAJ5390464.1 hypothetical protein N7496_001532 [Penicillium cataractarum]